MRRKPRSLFKARTRGRALYVGPEFAGPEPHYLACVDELLRRHGDQVEPGQVHCVEVRHDADCALFAGGPCDCAPVASLVARG